MIRLLFCLTLLSSVVFPSHVIAADNDTKQLSEQHLKKLRNDINELQGYLKKVQDDHKDLVVTLRKSDKDVAKISAQVQRLKKALKEERARLKKLQREQASLNKEKSQQQGILKDIVLATYKMGQEPQLKMLLNQQDPNLVARNLKYLQYFNEAHQKKIKTFRTTLNKINLVQNEVKLKEASLQTNLRDLRGQQKKLKEKQKTQQGLANTLRSQIKGSDQKLSRLIQDRQNLIELLGRVEEVFLPIERQQESRPFKSLKGKLPSPSGIKAKKLFGVKQDNGKQKWQGWLYPGRGGEVVRTIHHGRIVFSDWLRGFGLLTIVDHGQGYMSLYARNQALLKSVGDWVESGEIIAKLGQSGGFEKNGLYFELRHKGQPQNPKRWLKRG